ncbi:MAG: aspartate ammonia-lyase [Deltaproteobacteria bacterium]|nr:aspartate ammonia-lyase [Deltaproteobacteria bacterium]
MPKNKSKIRFESDTLGTRRVPSSAYWGIQTMRAIENFPISGIKPTKGIILATAFVKKAACLANLSLKLIDKKRGNAIIRAVDEILSGRLRDQFVVDVYQAGAGTSHNMNANEVIANRAIELIGGKKGDYRVIHPNDHVNMSQSTNDTMPTALRLAAFASSGRLISALTGLETTLRAKSSEFKGVIKSGRTHLQDAVPITLGQEFGSWAAVIKSSMENINLSARGLKRIGLGGTAIGTGLNTHPRFKRIVVRELSKVSGIKGLKIAPNSFEAINSAGDFTAYSSAMRGASIELIHIANDLRLLSSGPRTGLSEITLPAMQPGSSIMPGKVNPVMAEMLGMVCFQVIGNDLAAALAAQAGQLELNVMLPLIVYNILQSSEILTNAVTVFNAKCVSGIKADTKRCRAYFENSIGIATILNRVIGYENAAKAAKDAVSSGKSLREIIVEKGLLSRRELDNILSPVAVTKPSNPKRASKRRR